MTPFAERSDDFSYLKWKREDQITNSPKTEDEPSKKVQKLTPPKTAWIPELTEELYSKIKEESKSNTCTVSALSNCPAWTRRETELLLEFIKDYGQRWFLIHDQWMLRCEQIKFKQSQLKENDAPLTDKDQFLRSERTIDELKARFYLVMNCYHTVNNQPEKILHFDLEQERRRKEQLEIWFHRTPAQIEEELRLIEELKKIASRRDERVAHARAVAEFIAKEEILKAKNPPQSYSTAQETAGIEFCQSFNSSLSRVNKSSRTQLRNPKSADKAITNAFTFLSSPKNCKSVPITNLPFGTYMRSSTMKIPKRLDLSSSSVPRKDKQTAMLFQQYCGDVEKFPMVTAKTVDAYNQLRTDVIKLSEFNTAINELDQELEMLQKKRKLRMEQVYREGNDNS